MSSSSKPPESKLTSFFRKPKQPDSHGKKLSTVKSSAVATVIQRATSVLGAVGSTTITGQSVDPLINPPTNDHLEASGEGPLDSNRPAARSSYEPPAAPTSHVWVMVKQALDELHNCEYPGVLSPLKSVVGALCKCIDLMEMATDNDNEYKELASSLKRIAHSLRGYIKDRPNCDPISGSINQAAMSINQHIAKINAKRGGPAGRCLIGAQIHREEILKCTGEIECILQQLQMEISLSSLGLLDEISVNDKLQLLNPSKLARYDSFSAGAGSRGCTPGTRMEVLLDLDSWSNSSAAPHLRWINGMAGTGKTTIAYSHSEALDKRQKLAASFFCSRNSSECCKASRILPTIAYQLARFSPPFRAELCFELKKDSDLGYSNIPIQFKRLLQAPFKRIGRMPEGVVIVLDALDECEDVNAMRIVLNELTKHVEELPVKVLVTSRPLPGICQQMEFYYNSVLAPGSQNYNILSLHELNTAIVQADIRLYLKRELQSLDDNQVSKLTQQCGPLFIYAATLVRYVNSQPGNQLSPRRLEHIFSMSTNPSSNKRYEEIDSMYTMVLNTVFHNLEVEEADDVRLVLRTVLCAQEAISISMIATFCGLNNETSLFALKLLRSVVYHSDSDDLISIFHTSFPDFMFNQQRSGDFYCDPVEHNRIMAEQCFRLMDQGLQFNICRLESSYIPDQQNPELQSQIDNTITPALWYACCYWIGHLWHTTHSEDFHEAVKKLLTRRLFFWTEVFSLKQRITLGADVLFRTQAWLKDFSDDSSLVFFAEDARNFLNSFAANPVSVSTPHIYLSLLSFCPRSSAIFKCYSKYFRSLAEPDESVLQLREVAALSSWQREAEVTSVCYSPDGTRIAYGCLDGTVGLQNSLDGTSIFTTSRDQGHDQAVWSVAFSPPQDQIGNQAYVVSGSSDGTIRTWNALDGTALVIIRPLSGEIRCVATSANGTIASGANNGTVCIWNSPDGNLLFRLSGHSQPVWSVAFSLDGTRLASGSDDHTIRIWNPHSGQLMLGPLEAQRGDINTIAFSPDGTRMASGSNDRTVCVWDPHTGTAILGPFVAHNHNITSVTFSPDGRFLASSSLDRTIRVWDPVDGKRAAGPFEGHIGPICSIAFSPDNTRIISGSLDSTIRIWDPRQGALGDGALQSHSDAVFSVAFSPDGQHMASCSFDGTLRVWDLPDSIPVAIGNPLRGHTDYVMSLAFSPDGSRVVTGSADRTARVWNILEQRAPPVLFEEHEGVIWSVAFSPDGRFVASASGSGDNTIRLWDPSDGRSISAPLTIHTDDIKAVAISPDSKTLASGSRDKTLRVWDLKDTPNSLLLEGHTHTVWSVIYSHDGAKLASSSSDGTIRIWDPQTGTLVAEPIQAHTGKVSSIAFSPDSQYIASGTDDCAIRLWDTRTGDLVSGPYEGHHDVIWSVAYSPSGTHIISGSHDGTIRIWDVNNNAPAVSGGDTGTTNYFLELDIDTNKSFKR
ncbi:unnamed protein product [Rhizoctonia solani]|uniref:NACHT domain-containing protein n=1 Tax=Rhizoctonia solani TaxID=456999 RepID=A0A8H3DPB3_9AGAM|nr:unnamed protein product [Rhizoctonia solani]